MLLKPVPDPGEERLGDDGRLDRSVSAVINGNDEYVLEAALKLVEAHGGDVTLLSMAPENLTDPIRKALAMGATRALLVSDPALVGSCAWSTTQVLAAALRTLEFDLVLAGTTRRTGVPAWSPPAWPPSWACHISHARSGSNRSTAASASSV